jgi:hypothetical protein
MKNKVPGMDVPDELVKRMAGGAQREAAQEGIDICVESIERLREIEGVSGFHIMAIEWEEKGARDRRAGRALSPAAGITTRVPLPVCAGLKKRAITVKRRMAMSNDQLIWW